MVVLAISLGRLGWLHGVGRFDLVGMAVSCIGNLHGRVGMAGRLRTWMRWSVAGLVRLSSWLKWEKMGTRERPRRPMYVRNRGASARGRSPAPKNSETLLPKQGNSHEAVARAKPSASTGSQQMQNTPASRDGGHVPLPRAPGANDRRAGSLLVLHQTRNADAGCT